MKNAFHLTFSLTLSLSFLPTLAFCQQLSYTAQGRGTAIGIETDYHAIGLNASALGWGTGYDNLRITSGSGEFYAFMYSDSLNPKTFSDFYKVFRNQIGGKEYDSAASVNLQNSLRQLAASGTQIQINTGYLNVAFQSPKFGGIAFSINDQYGFKVKFNDGFSKYLKSDNWVDLVDSASIALNGDTSRIAFRPNLSSDTLAAIYSIHLKEPLNLQTFTKGSYLQSTLHRNFNLSYGRKILGKDSSFLLYAGVGARFIQSLANISFLSSESEFYLRTSVAPFQVTQEEAQFSQVSPYNYKAAGGFFPAPQGYGYGLDFSVSALFLKRFRVAAAINNLGAVFYKQRVYTQRDILPQEIALDGFSNEYMINNFQQLANGRQILKDEGEQKFTVVNPATFNLGGSFKPLNWWVVGAELTVPFQPESALSLNNPIVAIGTEIRPTRWLALMGGLWGGGDYGVQIPLGINFITGSGTAEFGVSSRDALLFFTGTSNSISMAVGTLRVRF